MQLIDDWRNILKNAWTVRFGILSGLLSVAEVALPYFQSWVPRGVFAALSLIVAFAVPYVRIVYQKDIV